MLRKVRITLAIFFFIAVTLLFLDFTGLAHAWLGWIAKIQFLPALLALNVGVVVALVVLTLLVGRIYCSVICPLGVFQDIVSWISGRRKKQKNRFSYSKEKRWLRLGVLFLFVVAFLLGIGSVVALLAPYSSYGRIASNLFAPIYRWGNNLLALIANYYDSYDFYETDVWIKSLPTFIIALLTLAVIIVLAWKNGRTYCNTICPVGTILGFLSRFSLYHPVIDAQKCKNVVFVRVGVRQLVLIIKITISIMVVAWLAWIALTIASTEPFILQEQRKQLKTHRYQCQKKRTLTHLVVFF